MFNKVKELMADKKIGDIRTVVSACCSRINLLSLPTPETNWRVDPAIAGAGLFYDLAPHQIDIILIFFWQIHLKHMA
jgi:predicted dehydrogenase